MLNTVESFSELEKSRNPVREFDPADFTILLVDDDFDQRSLIEFVIAQAGYKVISVGDAMECLNVMSRRYVDLVVCDIMLPEINGIEFVQRVKAMHMIPKDSTLPVILITALQEGREFDAQKAGADNFCLKRNAHKNLANQIQELLA